MSTRFSILAAAAAASLAFMQAASATSINFSLSSINLAGGAQMDSVIVSGFTPGQDVTGYNVYVDFDSSMLSVSNVTFGALPDDLGGTWNVKGGSLDVHDTGTGPDSAYSVESDPYTLFTITFTPTMAMTGTSSPTFDMSGSAYGPFQVTGLLNGSCGSSAPPGSCPYPNLLTFTSGKVPEPSSLALFGLGLGAIGVGLYVVRRRRGMAERRGTV